MSVKEKLAKYQKDAAALMRSGQIAGNGFISRHVRVTGQPDKVAEFLAAIDTDRKTRSGQKMWARGLTVAKGELHLDLVTVNLVAKSELGGGDGKYDRMLGVVNIAEDMNVQNMKGILYHEMCHMGQMLCSEKELSEREFGVYEGMLKEAEAYTEQLLAQADHFVIYRDEEALKKDFSNIFLKDKQRKQLSEMKRVMIGKQRRDFKEEFFLNVIESLPRFPIYSGHVLWACGKNGKSNMPLLKSLVKDMCERMNIRLGAVWPTIEAYANGTKEIPGVEGMFTKEGKVFNLPAEFGEKKYNYERIYQMRNNLPVYIDEMKTVYGDAWLEHVDDDTLALFDRRASEADPGLVALIPSFGSVLLNSKRYKALQKRTEQNKKELTNNIDLLTQYNQDLNKRFLGYSEGDPTKFLYDNLDDLVLTGEAMSSDNPDFAFVTSDYCLEYKESDEVEQDEVFQARKSLYSKQADLRDEESKIERALQCGYVDYDFAIKMGWIKPSKDKTPHTAPSVKRRESAMESI